MKININDFGKDFFGFMQQSHRDMSVDSIKAALKEIFTKHGINDSNFALISVAMSNSGMSTEIKNTSTYIDVFAKKLFDKAEKQKFRELHGRDPESTEEVKKAKRPKPFINLDAHKISKFASSEEIEQYVLGRIEALEGTGVDVSKLKTGVITEYTQNSYDLPIDLSLMYGKTLARGIADSVKSKSSEESKVTADKTKKIPADQYNILLDDVKERLKAALEGTADINVAGGFDVEKTAHLFVGRDSLLAAFESFIIKYNEIMNKILNHVLDENQITDIQDDINPAFEEMLSKASQYGESGAQALNICKGLKARIDHACQQERVDGRQNIGQEQASFNYSHEEQLDANDSDGQVVNCEHTEKEHSGSSVASEIDSIVGTSGLQSDLTPEVLEKIKDWGVEGIRTMADWIEFTHSEEYEMIQAMQSMSFEKHDDNN